jgi:hypothetical protein
MPWQTCFADEMLFNFDQPLVEKSESAPLSRDQDERRHRLAGLAVDSILKCSAARRSADNITAVAITFDNFYRVLDQSKKLNQSGCMDYEVLEIQKMEPIPLNPDLTDSKNVIYIENDDVLEASSDIGTEA